MKKFLALFLALLMALSLFACKKPTPKPEESEQESEDIGSESSETSDGDTESADESADDTESSEESAEDESIEGDPAEYGREYWENKYPGENICPFYIEENGTERSYYWVSGLEGWDGTMASWINQPFNWNGWHKTADNCIVNEEETLKITDDWMQGVEALSSYCTVVTEPYEPDAREESSGDESAEPSEESSEEPLDESSEAEDPDAEDPDAEDPEAKVAVGDSYTDEVRLPECFTLSAKVFGLSDAFWLYRMGDEFMAVHRDDINYYIQEGDTYKLMTGRKDGDTILWDEDTYEGLSLFTVFEGATLEFIATLMDGNSYCSLYCKKTAETAEIAGVNTAKYEHNGAAFFIDEATGMCFREDDGDTTYNLVETFEAACGSFPFDVPSK